MLCKEFRGSVSNKRHQPFDPPPPQDLEQIRPEQLSQHRVTLQQVFTALQNNNSNTGGNVLKTGEQSLVVRGVNALANIEDIEHVAIANYNGHPVYVGDVADVRTGMAPRQGIVAYYRAGSTPKPGVDDLIEGIVVNRKGTNAKKVIFAFCRLRYATLIMLKVPFVLIGAVALLSLTHTNLSVSAMIGFIALSGVNVLNGTVLVGQFNQLRAHGVSLHEAVIEGSKTRLRLVLMSALMAAIGMYPAAHRMESDPKSSAHSPWWC